MLSPAAPAGTFLLRAEIRKKEIDGREDDRERGKCQECLGGVTHNRLTHQGRLSWRPPSFGLASQTATGVFSRIASGPIGELIEAALGGPAVPTPAPAQRRKLFRVIQGDLFE